MWVHTLDPQQLRDKTFQRILFLRLALQLQHSDWEKCTEYQYRSDCLYFHAPWHGTRCVYLDLQASGAPPSGPTLQTTNIYTALSLTDCAFRLQLSGKAKEVTSEFLDKNYKRSHCKTTKGTKRLNWEQEKVKSRTCIKTRQISQKELTDATRIQSENRKSRFAWLGSQVWTLFYLLLSESSKGHFWFVCSIAEVPVLHWKQSLQDIKNILKISEISQTFLLDFVLDLDAQPLSVNFAAPLQKVRWLFSHPQNSRKKNSLGITSPQAEFSPGRNKNGRKLSDWTWRPQELDGTEWDKQCLLLAPRTAYHSRDGRVLRVRDSGEGRQEPLPVPEADLLRQGTAPGTCAQERHP